MSLNPAHSLDNSHDPSPLLSHKPLNPNNPVEVSRAIHQAWQRREYTHVISLASSAADMYAQSNASLSARFAKAAEVAHKFESVRIEFSTGLNFPDHRQPLHIPKDPGCNEARVYMLCVPSRSSDIDPQPTMNGSNATVVTPEDDSQVDKSGPELTVPDKMVIGTSGVTPIFGGKKNPR